MANVTVPTQDHIWEQSEDLIVEIVYKHGEDGVPLDEATHAVRMDIADKDGNVVFSFNSADLDDTELDEPGEHDNEVTFPTDTPGLIHIKVPRSVTLSPDVSPSQGPYQYDLFIRNINEDTQRKLLKGKIIVNPSVTLWP